MKIYSKVTDFIDYKPAIDMITEKQIWLIVKVNLIALAIKILKL